MRRILLSTTAIAGMVATLVVSPLPAAATPHIHRHTTATQSFSSTVAGLNWTGYTIALNEFDTTLGSLQSVLVTEQLTGSFKGSASASSASTTATVTAATSLTVTGGPAALDGMPLLTLSGNKDLAVGLTPASLLIDAGSTGSPMSYDPSVDWESVGPATTLIMLDSLTSAASPPGILVNVTPTLTFTLDVAYNYQTTTSDSATPSRVPEPASALMLGAGLIALGAARRWRRQ
ncbi:MAG TPA: VPLPA-CTERM sorting domain-containing protein [Acetobacteraceae bacterium]|nr:VPLPA-CTERM sorting domain-containing protein [Acetobacteraceae bacterium]